MAGALEALIGSRVSNRSVSRPITSISTGYGNAGASSSAVAGWRNPTINAGLRLLARQLAQPQFVGRRYRRSKGETRTRAMVLRAQGLRNDAGAKQVDLALVMNGFTEQVFEHPLIKLLNHPNPVMKTGDQLWGMTAILDQWLFGNAYILKARDENLGTVAELWRLRPDMVRIIPDANGIVAGYEYRHTKGTERYSADDIIHLKTLNPFDAYYGEPLLLPIIDALEIDAEMKDYLKGYYRSGGSGPGAVFTTEEEMTPDEIEEIRNRKNRMFSKGRGAHEWLILSGTKSTYQSLGLDRGLAAGLPKEVAALVAAELSMCLGVPGSILGQLIGYESSSYANKRQDWQVLWDVTLTPQMEQLDHAINDAFLNPEKPEFGGIDEIYSDLSSIPALQEDASAIQERHLKNLAGGAEFWEEARIGLGLDPNRTDGTLFVPTTVTAIPGERLGEPLDEPLQVGPPEVTVENLGSQMAVDIAVAMRGRPKMLADPTARATWEQAEALRERNPSLTLAQVAARVGISERQYRRYRGEFS
jgi:HK97 family phage portal protein